MQLQICYSLEHSEFSCCVFTLAVIYYLFIYFASCHSSHIRVGVPVLSFCLLPWHLVQGLLEQYEDINYTVTYRKYSKPQFLCVCVCSPTNQLSSCKKSAGWRCLCINCISGLLSTSVKIKWKCLLLWLWESVCSKSTMLLYFRNTSGPWHHRPSLVNCQSICFFILTYSCSQLLLCLLSQH